MEEIYEFLEKKAYEHDFYDIENTSTDPDGFYLWKYPHEGKGKVEPTDPNEWKEYVSDDLASTIMSRFEGFNSHFNYK
jgi:hypothetical protein